MIVFINTYFFSTISQTGLEQEDYHLPDHVGPHSEIIYTVKDVSSIEQGQGGFVRAVKGNHYYFFCLFGFLFMFSFVFFFCFFFFPFTFKLLIVPSLKR